VSGSPRWSNLAEGEWRRKLGPQVTDVVWEAVEVRSNGTMLEDVVAGLGSSWRGPMTVSSLWRAKRPMREFLPVTGV
jgi:hypothetical protein